MTRLALMTDVVRTATDAVRLKHRMTRRELRRGVCKAVQRKQYAEIEAELAKAMEPLFRRQIESAAGRLAEMAGNMKAAGDADVLVKQIFNPDEWHEELIDRVTPVLVRMMAEAAVATLLMVGVDVRKGGLKTYECPGCGEKMAAYMPEVSPPSVARRLEPVCYRCSSADRFAEAVRGMKTTASKSTASEWLEGADQDVPLPEYFDTPAGPVSIGIAAELPAWMQAGIAERLRESFKQPYWRKIHETTGGDIERVLDHGLKEGLSIREMSKRMVPSLGGDAYAKIRATNIARTESGHALNGARDMSIEELKEEMGPEAAQWVGKSWLSVLGNTTRDTHAAADGQLADEEGMFTVGGYQTPWPGHYNLPPGERCNCFPIGTLVEGDFVGAQKGWYKGIFTEIILRSGGRLTVTEQHPIVTPEGLIPAGRIKPGQNVMTYCAEIDGTPFVASCGDEVQNEPSPIEKIFEAFLARAVTGAAFSSIEIKRAQIDDFHGDGESFQGNIEIVRADWKLLEDGVFGQFEKRGDSIFVFELAELSLKFDSCSSGFAYDGICLPSAGGPSLAKRTLNVFRRFEVTPTGSLAVGVAADFDASLDQSAAKDGSCVSGFLGEALQRHAGRVAFDDVVEVRNFYSAGHVFDLHSRYGLIVACDPESYNGKVGIVAANCQCTITTELGAGAPEEEIEAIMQETEGALRQ